ncbi:urea transporter 2-like [Discoglossus pictus]
MSRGREVRIPAAADLKSLLGRSSHHPLQPSLLIEGSYHLHRSGVLQQDSQAGGLKNHLRPPQVNVTSEVLTEPKLDPRNGSGYEITSPGSHQSSIKTLWAITEHPQQTLMKKEDKVITLKYEKVKTMEVKVPVDMSDIIDSETGETEESSRSFRGSGFICSTVQCISGDMREFADWLQDKPIPVQFIDWSLRGISQATFANNPLSGLIILSGLFLHNPWWAITGCLGTIVSTITAIILSQDRSAIAAGCYGNNGILVGLLIPIFSSMGDWYWWLLFPVALTSMTLPIFTSALNSIFSKWDLPIFTLPFNLAVCLYLAATGHYNGFFPTVLIESVNATTNMTWSDLDIPLLLRAIPIGVGQFYGCGNVWAGAMFMAAYFLSSPILFFHAAIGSAIGILAGLSLAAPFDELYLGLWGYNPGLTCMAVGGMFYALTWQSHLLAIASALFCAYLEAALGNVMSVFGLPSCTFAFCLSSAIIVLIKTNNPEIYKMPLYKVTYPEANRIYFLKQKKERRENNRNNNRNEDN